MGYGCQESIESNHLLLQCETFHQIFDLVMRFRLLAGFSDNSDSIKNIQLLLSQLN